MIAVSRLTSGRWTPVTGSSAVAHRPPGKLAVAASRAVRSSSMTNRAGPGRSRRNVTPNWPKLIRATRPLVVAAGVVVLALGVVLGLLWPLTDVIAAHDVGLIAGPKRAAALQASREAVRTQLLTLGAGVFAACALWFTARNFILSREGHVTDRYTKAIEQLGSGKLDVRIGGIYALERVARDSARDHPTVMEVLTAFIREHSREPGAIPEPASATIERRTRPDVQAALTVVGRRDHSQDRATINLTSADLREANLTRADLFGADLTSADLTSADLREANLSGAMLVRADLTSARLLGADLTSADLTGARLAGANIYDANLTGARLTSTDLTGAILTDADLTKADLMQADLTRGIIIGANLIGANLVGAILSGANLRRANLRNANLTDTRFVGADLNDADFTGAHWPDPHVAAPDGWARRADSGRLQRVVAERDEAT